MPNSNAQMKHDTDAPSLSHDDYLSQMNELIWEYHRISDLEDRLTAFKERITTASEMRDGPERDDLIHTLFSELDALRLQCRSL